MAYYRAYFMFVRPRFHFWVKSHLRHFLGNVAIASDGKLGNVSPEFLFIE